MHFTEGLTAGGQRLSTGDFLMDQTLMMIFDCTPRQEGERIRPIYCPRNLSTEGLASQKLCADQADQQSLRPPYNERVQQLSKKHDDGDRSRGWMVSFHNSSLRSNVF